jgi:acyl-homoserine-lactone acylase
VGRLLRLRTTDSQTKDGAEGIEAVRHWVSGTALALLVGLTTPTGVAAPAGDLARWERQAARVTIVRDDWGIAHVRGRSDADAVFGMVYAQAEDDFNRVETNFINAQGRLAETEGESAIWQDLRMKLFIDPVDMRAKYAASPAWLKTLMVAWADGLNYYLATHPTVRPRVIDRFEPWMALTFSEGSIGGDIERVDLTQLEAFYGRKQVAVVEDRSFKEPGGSNGFAIAPANAKDGHPLLLINPHTSFFFRSELQVSSDEGLNAYGAATWGQFFIYQGFNAQAGWMHTSSGVDVVDEFAETIVRRGGRLFYRYGKEERPVRTRTIAVPYRAADGTMASRTFTAHFTHHGPFVRTEGDKWISIALMQRPVEALQQSFLRTKAKDYASFVKVGELKANSSNNTIFADAKGNIAYLHPQFVPVRDDRFDYTKPVDGSDPATDWKGITSTDRTPRLLNPANGWIMNTNNWPWSAAGANSPRATDFPRYMDTAGENPRGIHAVRVLDGHKGFTVAGLLSAAYDPYLPAFATLVPLLVQAYDALPASDPRKAKLADAIATLRAWNYQWAADSIATSIAVFWGEALWKGSIVDARAAGGNVWSYMAARTTPEQKIAALEEATGKLTADFGRWKTPWGEINRFQRVSGTIVQPFDDSKPSISVPFTSSQWGSLASFGARAYPGTKRYYGTSGNSFVAVVEFGDRVRARAISAGGESGDPASQHFNDQAARYAAGDLRDVYFYPDELAGHTERTYRPGAGSGAGRAGKASVSISPPSTR